MNRLTIAIDGPSGSGKSTLGKRLAAALGYVYIDTGAMYRAVGLYAVEQGVALDDPPSLERLTAGLSFEFSGHGREQRLLIDGRDVTDRIRTPEIAQAASKVSAVSVVRRILVRRQQEMGRRGGVVMDGRDIGTVVFPGADVKFYIDASAEERARRRCLEDQERGLATDLADTIREIRERDHRDMNRQDSPLKQAPDAIRLDTTRLSPEEVFQEALAVIHRQEHQDVHRTD